MVKTLTYKGYLIVVDFKYWDDLKILDFKIVNLSTGIESTIGFWGKEDRVKVSGDGKDIVWIYDYIEELKEDIDKGFEIEWLQG